VIVFSAKIRPNTRHEADMLTRDQFQKHLRDALNHLHDPDRLCKSPLAPLFGAASSPDAYSALQQILTEAIASLEPKANVPSSSRAWRIYDLLSCRYVQELNVAVVAEQLGVSVRHLRREQNAALDALSYRLWEQFDLEKGLDKKAGTGPPAPGTEAGPSVDQELAWLREIPPEHPADLDQVLSSVLDLARPLAEQHDVHLETIPIDALPELAVYPIIASQAVLNLLSVVILWASGGRVRVSVKPLRWEVEVVVEGLRHQPDPQTISHDAAGLDMVRRLADLCGGKVRLVADEDAIRATLTLPALERLPVLVIDDNADTLQLLQRYTAGTRYHLIGTQDPEQALTLAEAFSPQIVVLDVMMPQVDGWKVLARLRQNPLTDHIPIVVCTILPQEPLALSLGAAGFVRKPLTRQAFLAALDHQMTLVGPGSR
jgi:CheY-like chemotaxis protein